MLLAIDFDKDFIDEEGVAVASAFPLQSFGVNSSEFDTPEPDRFSAHSDAALGQEILYISMAQVEPVVEPDGVGNYIWWGAPSWKRWRL
ncbi:MAG: hypothetical protein ACJARI_001836 [Bacteroidia bacterium]|jgi:hypothetical protein